MADILSVQNIQKSFNGICVLKGVTFKLRRGEVHGIVGENGAGKSTLMKIIAGDYQKDDGEIFFDGSPISIRSPSESLALGIRVIYQEFNLIKKLSVAENICIGDYPRTKFGLVDKSAMNRRAVEVLDRLDVHIDVQQRVSQISIAEQQIVEIAKAIRNNPKVLIMDEPTAALNDQETSRLFRIIKKLKQEGVSIVFITHRLSEQFELSDRITVMRDGAVIKTFDTAQTSSDELVKLMVGRSITDAFMRNRRFAQNQVLFETRHLNVDHRIRDINIHVNKGEIVTIFGLMGAGQKELCHAIFGDTKYESGEILMDGKPLRLRSPKEAITYGMGMVTDDRRSEGIFDKLGVKENLTISVLRKLAVLGCLKGKEESHIAENWVQKLNVKCASLAQKISSLSGGNQQKVLIARWLANDSHLLILNLPTRGIDVGAKSEIYTILEDLCSEGMGILIVSLEMQEVLGISDRIYVMCDGSITGEVSALDATQDLLMKYAVSKYL